MPQPLEIADLIAGPVSAQPHRRHARARGRPVIPASVPTQRPSDARLLVIDAWGAIHAPCARGVSYAGPRRATSSWRTTRRRCLRASPASICRPGAAVEVRLAGRDSLLPRDATRFTAVVFGAGDFRTPTEHRPPPPVLQPGDALRLGPLRCDGASRCWDIRGSIEIRFEGRSADIWEGLARHGRPIQYALRAAAAGDLGHVDAIRRPSRGVRSAVGGVHPRLGRASARSARAARRSPASPTPPASPRRATPSSIGCCRSTSRTTYRLPRRR